MGHFSLGLEQDTVTLFFEMKRSHKATTKVVLAESAPSNMTNGDIHAFCPLLAKNSTAKIRITPSATAPS